MWISILCLRLHNQSSHIQIQQCLCVCIQLLYTKAAHEHSDRGSQPCYLFPNEPYWTVTSRCSPYISLYVRCLTLFQHPRPKIDTDDRVQCPPMPSLTSQLHKPPCPPRNPSIVGRTVLRRTSCHYTTVQAERSLCQAQTYQDTHPSFTKWNLKPGAQRLKLSLVGRGVSLNLLLCCISQLHSTTKDYA